MSILLGVGLTVMLISGLLLGAYRSYCRFIETKSDAQASVEVPQLWRSANFQLITSLIVTLFSYYPAHFGSLHMGYTPPEPMFFVWLILLLSLRYFISSQVGFWLYWRWKQGRPLL